jgi:hypothetical protein
MHEIGDGSTLGESLITLSRDFSAPLRIARAKSTVNEGQSAILPGKSGTIEIFRKTFPGLWLDVEALLKDDLAELLDILQEGLASSEHTDFVKQLLEGKK